jgi:hypothetical protein
MPPLFSEPNFEKLLFWYFLVLPLNSYLSILTWLAYSYFLVSKCAVLSFFWHVNVILYENAR